MYVCIYTHRVHTSVLMHTHTHTHAHKHTQCCVRMWLARARLDSVRLDCATRGLFLSRYSLSSQLSAIGGGGCGEKVDTVSVPTVMGPPGPPGGMLGLPEIGAGAMGLARKQQQQHLIDAIHWRFMGEEPPPPSRSLSLDAFCSDDTRLPLMHVALAGDPHRAMVSEYGGTAPRPNRGTVEVHPHLRGQESKEWVMYGVDVKRCVHICLHTNDYVHIHI